MRPYRVNQHDKWIAEYLSKEPDYWDDGSFKVHVSELTSCKRQVAYRLLRAPRAPLTSTKVRLFHLGHYLHDLHYEAMDYAHVLYAKERSLHAFLPEGVTGRFDYIRRPQPDVDKDLILGDDKTTHPNMIRFSNSLPKMSHATQVSTYYHWMEPEVAKLLADVVEINYMDRGGSNSSCTCRFHPLPKDELEPLIAEYVQVAKDIEANGEDALPECLPEDLFWSYRNPSGGGYFSYGPSWECGYCGYRMCPQWHKRGRLVCKTAKTYGYRWTSFGQKLLRKNPQRISDFLFGHQKYVTLLEDSGDNVYADEKAGEVLDSFPPKDAQNAARKVPMAHSKMAPEVAKIAGHEVEREVTEGEEGADDADD